jgi:exodeoxyribonuclease-3
MRTSLFVAAMLAVSYLVPQAAFADTVLTVMSFNIYGGGANEDKPVDETVAVIQAVGADIIGVQETRLEGDPCTADDCPPMGDSVAKAIADALGFHYYDQTQTNEALWANAIISRYPIGAATANDLGVAIDVEGQTVYAFNIHLDDSPYQPYQLLSIEYGDAPFITTEAEAVRFAQETRGPALKLLMEHQPVAVRYPTTLAIEEQGFVDAFRAAFSDEVAKPGYTWTPTTDPSDPEDHHDRIDFVFARAPNLVVEKAGIVGEKAPEADIVVTPWPSDHRAVAATVQF